MLAASNLPRREVILISDFQRSGWSPGDGLRLPAGTTRHAGDGQRDRGERNLAVVPVGIQRDQASGQDRVTVTAGVVNRSDESITNVPIALEFDGRVVQSAQIAVQPTWLGLDDLPAGDPLAGQHSRHRADW